ncbi:RHS repeat protein, partial [Cerasicoccus arenae]
MIGFLYSGRTRQFSVLMVAVAIASFFGVRVDGSNNNQPPFSFSITASPPQEMIGSKYRKIALNGAPLSDEKPQNEGETDYVREETYVDALSLSLNHSVTDIYVPIPGSDLALSVRRNYTGDVWRDPEASMLTPYTQPDRPFGPGWSSNLAANVKIELTSTVSQSSYYFERYVYVTDENGAAHRFVQGLPIDTDWNPTGNQFWTTKIALSMVYQNSPVFTPFPNDTSDIDTLQSTLEMLPDESLKFTKKFGTVLIYELSSYSHIAPDLDPDLYSFDHGVRYNYSPNDCTVSSVTRQSIQYYRLKSVTDRYGNALNYYYDVSNATLIPNEIRRDNSITNRIQIEIDDSGEQPRIEWVKDPMDNTINYTYGSVLYDYDEDGVADASIAPNDSFTALTKVTKPEGVEAEYSYDVFREENVPQVSPASMQAFRQFLLTWRPVLGMGCQPFENHAYHFTLRKITDGNDKEYGFTYQFNSSLWAFEHSASSDSFFEGYYQTIGHPTQVASITLPETANTVLFSQTGEIKWRYQITQTFTGWDLPNVDESTPRVTTVTDARENERIYRFQNPAIYPVLESNIDIHDLNTIQAPPTLFVYDTMEIEYPDTKTETVVYDPNLSLAPVSVTDYSGNTTTFDYTDQLSAGFGVPSRDANGDAVNLATFNPEPTSQTNAKEEVREYSYGAYFIMTEMIDEEGRKVSTPVDGLGRRTKEEIYNADDSLIQRTIFTYDTTYRGVVVSETVESLNAYAPTKTTTYGLYGSSDSDGPPGYVKSITIDGDTTFFKYDLNGNRIEVKNPRTYVTTYVYDDLNRLTDIIYPTGFGSESYEYDFRSNRTKFTDANGHVTHYEYDGLNRLVKETRDVSTGNLITEFGYNALNARTSVTDPETNVTEFGYDALNRLISKTDPDITVFDPVANSSSVVTPVTSYFYDGDNPGASLFDTDSFKPTSTIDPRGYETTITYDKLYRPTLESVEYKDDVYAVTQKFYDKVGNVTKIIDPLLKETSYQYDGLDRVTKTTFQNGDYTSTSYSTGVPYYVRDEEGNEVYTQYDAAGRPVKVIQPGNVETEYEYDANGNVAVMTNPNDKDWDYTFDAMDRQTHEYQPIDSYIAENGSIASGRPTTITGYDNIGNITSVTDPRGYVNITYYDEVNRPIKIVSPVVDTTSHGSVSPTTFISYDKNGNLFTQSSGYGDTLIRTDVTNSWDEMNRLESTTDGAAIVVEYGYDKVGNRTMVEDGEDQRTRFVYDGLNRNTTTYHPDGSSKSMDYNAINLTLRTDEMGRTTEYDYDDRHRLSTVTYSNGGGSRSYSYDKVGNILTVTESNALANVAYVYDDLYRITSETSAGINHVYGYDDAGNRVLAKYGDGQSGVQKRLRSTYNASNLTLTIYEDDNNNETWDSGERISEYGYDLAGNIREKLQANEDLIKKTYDTLNRTDAITGPVGSDTPTALPLYQYEQEYDLFGNLAKITETYPSVDSKLEDRVITNTYDGANRLKVEAIVSGTETVTTTYGYDDANNRVGKEVELDDGSAVTTVEDSTNTVNNLNQITAYSDSISAKLVNYTYDDAGNRATRVESGVTTNYVYDHENRLIGLGDGTDTYAYAYDYRTRRVLRDESSAGGEAVYVVFSGGTSIQEWQEDGAASGFTPASDDLIVDYVRGSDYGGGIGGILYTIRDLDSGGVLNDASFNHYNSRGDVVAKMDDAGAIIYQAAYEAFSRHGDTPSSQEWGTNPDRQQGNTKDEDPTGLLNEGFRYRDLETGTFITRDPLGFVDGPNLYTYVVQ